MLKREHCLSKIRKRGIPAVTEECLLSAMALNLKRMVRAILLTSHTLKIRAKNILFQLGFLFCQQAPYCTLSPGIFLWGAILSGHMLNLLCGASILHLTGGLHKSWDRLRLIKDYTILKAIRTAPCSEKRQMTIPDVSCIPIKEPIDCFQAKRLFRTGSSQTFTLSLPSSASACLKSSSVRKK